MDNHIMFLNRGGVEIELSRCHFCRLAKVETRVTCLCANDPQQDFCEHYEKASSDEVHRRVELLLSKKEER